ncbi:MAG: LLM class F420-dependent oxidoreductase [Chloroflexi bacterium]|nr:MAG: LLM class F420-dependent oxidoreductase [Chloroflexota bacterium]
MKVGLVIPNFTWPGGPSQLGATLARIACAAEDAGFASVWVMDHLFQIGRHGPPEHEMLEAYATLGYLAGITTRVELGTMVTAVGFRHPGVLAKTVTTLDVLSGGRAWLGIGAGGANEDEALGLGIPYPPLGERLERLDEALGICRQMWAGDERPFAGRHYHLTRPLNSPQSLRRPHPPILVGGSGERKTLRLVARHADACNLFPTPEIPRKLDALRAHCEREGRDYDEIERTSIFDVDLAARGVEETVGALRWLAGMGIQSVVLNVREAHRLEPLHAVGERVIPAVADL